MMTLPRSANAFTPVSGASSRGDSFRQPTTQHSRRANAIRLGSSFRQGQQIIASRFRKMVRRLSGPRLLPSFAGWKIHLSTKRVRQQFPESPETRRVLLSSCRVLQVLREFFPRACLRDLSAVSQDVQQRDVLRVSRGIVSACRQLMAFSFLSCRLVVAIVFQFCRHQTTRVSILCLESASSSPQQQYTTATTAKPNDGMASGRILCRFRSRSRTRFNRSDASFQRSDSVCGFFAENVRPILHDGQRSGRQHIAADCKRSSEHHSNLFGIKAGSCFCPWLISSLPECDVAGGTGHSGERFSNRRRACQFNQLSEFARPGIAPQKRKTPPRVHAERRIGRILAPVPR